MGMSRAHHASFWKWIVLGHKLYNRYNLNVLHKGAIQPWPSLVTAALSWFLASQHHVTVHYTLNSHKPSNAMNLGNSDHVLAPAKTTVHFSLCEIYQHITSKCQRMCEKLKKKNIIGTCTCLTSGLGSTTSLGDGLYIIISENSSPWRQ